MTYELRVRLSLIILLAMLGAGLAIAGTAIGATDPLTPPGENAEFSVSDDRVTFERAGQQTTLLNNVSKVTQIEITQLNSGTFELETQSNPPVTDADRKRAKAIVRNNETVESTLSTLESYNMTVEPIRELSVEATQTASVSELDSTNTTVMSVESDANHSFSVSRVNGTVSIDRDPDYVENEVAVRIKNPTNDETEYTVTVDLANETIVDMTRWNSS